VIDFQAEYGEDIFLHQNYEDYFVKPGFWVDCGCGSAHFKSNTAWLRSLGWTGLAIDGLTDWQAEWGDSFVHAVLHTEPRVRFQRDECLYRSRVGAGEEVETRRLDEILFSNRVKEIGLLSVDVEGQETEVLRSMGLFPQHLWPRFIISEYATDGIGEDFSARDLLLEKGYRVIHQTVANLIYERP